MSRQERRQKQRLGKAKFPWDKLAIPAVLALLMAVIGVSYFFPIINEKSYTSGNTRLQKLVINRGIDKLLKKTAMEFEYSYDNATKSGLFQVREDETKVILKAEETINEYPLTGLPEYYQSVYDMLKQIKRAVADKTFKVSYSVQEGGAYYGLIVDKGKVDAPEHEYYGLYFNKLHELDIIHFYHREGEDKKIQRV
ncbi:MAG: hypothetical protein Q8N36_00665, partial [bacterium]|nr:hypothetical protein [bacterium]